MSTTSSFTGFSSLPVQRIFIRLRSQRQTDKIYTYLCFITFSIYELFVSLFLIIFTLMFIGLICKDSSYRVAALDGVENTHVEQSAITCVENDSDAYWKASLAVGSVASRQHWCLSFKLLFTQLCGNTSLNPSVSYGRVVLVGITALMSPTSQNEYAALSVKFAKIKKDVLNILYVAQLKDKSQIGKDDLKGWNPMPSVHHL